MATIELYKDKINSMSNYIQQAKNAVSDFCVDLSALKSKILGINSSVCDNVVSSISSSSQTQEQQIEGLEATQKQVNAFIDLTINRDNAAAAAVSKAKDEFYKEYSYLKPECEKSGWEKFCDGLKKVGDWCKDHWKEIVLAIEIIAAVACLFIPGLQGIGVGILLGALKGAITGGLIGGITSLLSGGSFLEGFAQGALDGAIMGGALGGVGGLAGKFITCGSKLGNAIQTTAKVSGTISNGMDGFDMLSLGMGMIDPDNPLTELNNKLHQSDIYNGFQTGMSMLSSLTGAASQNMVCFIAGTKVLTVAGLVAIENIKAGDMVISTNPDTLETAEKTVLETYVRQVNKLVNLTINGEKIVTTDNHPFYVQGRGFINAGSLLVGDKLISVNGDDLTIEDYHIELTKEPVSVYNFQVEDFHTYFVGDCAVWVHNAECSHTALKQTEFRSSYDDRLKQTPGDKNKFVEFKDKALRGESMCTLKPPPDAELKSILDGAGIDGIEYKNAVPDFSPVSKLELDGIDMTSGRTGGNGTYSQANNKFAQMLNESQDLANDFGIKPKNGTTFTGSDVKKYMKDNKLTWHELNDLTTVQMVPTKINSKFGHLGGISEAASWRNI